MFDLLDGMLGNEQNWRNRRRQCENSVVINAKINIFLHEALHVCLRSNIYKVMFEPNVYSFRLTELLHSWIDMMAGWVSVAGIRETEDVRCTMNVTFAWYFNNHHENSGIWNGSKSSRQHLCNVICCRLWKIWICHSRSSHYYYIHPLNILPHRPHPLFFSPSFTFYPPLSFSLLLLLCPAISPIHSLPHLA